MMRKPSSVNNPKENNRRGKTRNLFKKTGEIKGTYHAKMDLYLTPYTKVNSKNGSRT